MIPTAPVTVVICTRNEELNLADCLDSVRGWVREVFVVDSASADRTREICVEYGARVIDHASDYIGRIRNWALETLPFQTEWVLFLDADERVLPELRDEIVDLLAEDGRGKDGFYLNRRFIFYGQWIRHSGWYPSWNLRLFRHQLGRYEDRISHEHVLLRGQAGYCRHDLLHEDHRDIDFWIAKHNRYATNEAAEYGRILERTHRTGCVASFFGGSVARKRAIKERLWLRLPGRALIYFFYLYVVRRGFLDGRLGFHFCVMHAIFEHFISMKLWERRRLEQSSASGREEGSLYRRLRRPLPDARAMAPRGSP